MLWLSAVSVYSRNFAISSSDCLNSVLPVSLGIIIKGQLIVERNFVLLGLSCALPPWAARSRGIRELKLWDVVFRAVNCELQNNSATMRWHV